MLFKEATERPRSSPLNEEKRPGAFVCAACNLALFDADTKYESGTGWPSFYQAIEGRVETKRDWKLILPRTEYHCAVAKVTRATCSGTDLRPLDSATATMGSR